MATDNFTNALDMLKESEPQPIAPELKKKRQGISVDANTESSKKLAAAMDYRSEAGLCLKCGKYESMSFCPFCFLLMSPKSEYSERLRDLNKKYGSERTIEELHELVGW